MKSVKDFGNYFKCRLKESEMSTDSEDYHL